MNGVRILNARAGDRKKIEEALRECGFGPPTENGDELVATAPDEVSLLTVAELENELFHAVSRFVKVEPFSTTEGAGR